ncbi:hypothetical protein [Jannaschia pohangensis]|uniref:Ferrochelatase n=1 Tax=Jannaschia pohangensis TaxID=390807 RepID=A0A1I3I1U9_9RHOB|nr:hypothetical protein [Jannaschia pohangensis]SFI41803.1 hypothetical protein SAMN04488095_0783 [Jannaschia pohangensis]
MTRALTLAAAIAVATATTAAAGNTAPAPVEPQVIVSDTSSSAGEGYIVPLLFLVFLANALGN